MDDLIGEVEAFLLAVRRGSPVQCRDCGKWISLYDSFGSGPVVGTGELAGYFCGDAPSYCWSKRRRF